MRTIFLQKFQGNDFAAELSRAVVVKLSENHLDGLLHTDCRPLSLFHPWESELESKGLNF